MRKKRVGRSLPAMRRKVEQEKGKLERKKKGKAGNLSLGSVIGCYWLYV